MQIVLLRVVWHQSPKRRADDRWLAYVIAIPPCVGAICIWIVTMVEMVRHTWGFHTPSEQIILPIVIVIVAWLYSVIVIPISFLLSKQTRRDIPFLLLRATSWISLVLPLIAGELLVEGF
ncbi:MAG: hypothetical protein AAFV88_24760 [Planctomycetota bacterium]